MTDTTRADDAGMIAEMRRRLQVAAGTGQMADYLFTTSDVANLLAIGWWSISFEERNRQLSLALRSLIAEIRRG